VSDLLNHIARTGIRVEPFLQVTDHDDDNDDDDVIMMMMMIVMIL
jgi:hypothetical protein